MKKSIILLGLALAAVSCNLNDLKSFDDNDAFAAFSTSAVSVAENGGTLSIPVHLTSLGGVATSVSYTIKDGSAAQGKDFTVAGGTGVLNFAAGETEKTIDFNIIEHPEVFTGDLRFSVELTSAGDVALGAATVATVTINDLDHPLSKILGTYTAHYVSYWGDEYDAEITIDKDPDDLSMVWISNLDPYFASYGYTAPKYNYFYGIVNEDKTEIALPVGQLVGYDDVELATTDDLPVVFTISPDGKTLTSTGMFGVAASDGWWELYLPEIVFTKVD